MKYKKRKDCRTTEQFIKDSKLVHGSNFDYSLVNYINVDNKIQLKCNMCGGVFWQLASTHLSGSGCKKCHIEKLKSSKEEFIKKSVIIHSFEYDYAKVIYINAKSKVEIKHNICGKIFQITPDRHLRGQKCSYCYGNMRSGRERFIEKSNSIHHNVYDYSLVEYKNAKTKVTIICKYHGRFLQEPQVHLKGRGCPQCKRACYSSKPEKEWLNSLNLNLDKQKHLTINNTKYIVDGFDSLNNTIYEFYGDYFHGNPLKYKFYYFNEVMNKSFGELYDRTIERERIFRNAGFKVISIWENEWKNIKAST
jgi:hypothetical protein